MDHLAIMKNNGFLEKIESGEKTIESRWYKFKKTPYDTVKTGDQIYFKRSGNDVTLTSKVSKVIQFYELNEKKIKEILNVYGGDIGIEKEDTNKFFLSVKDKRYCVLIFLTSVKHTDPFKINKNGYGNMSAWISVKDINKIRI
jgi:ASC-1-like (ASCH) protein